MSLESKSNNINTKYDLIPLQNMRSIQTTFESINLETGKPLHQPINTYLSSLQTCLTQRTRAAMNMNQNQNSKISTISFKLNNTLYRHLIKHVICFILKLQCNCAR